MGVGDGVDDVELPPAADADVDGAFVGVLDVDSLDVELCADVEVADDEDDTEVLLAAFDFALEAV